MGRGKTKKRICVRIFTFVDLKTRDVLFFFSLHQMLDERVTLLR
jgi:hypothetical protein